MSTSTSSAARRGVDELGIVESARAAPCDLRASGLYLSEALVDPSLHEIGE